MLNLKPVKITPEILKLICEIDEFKGGWRALEEQTTALQVLGDVAKFGQNFKAVLDPWQNQPFTEDVIKTLHGAVIAAGNPESRGAYKKSNHPLIVQKGQEIIGTLEAAAPEDVPPIMDKLVPWVQEALDQEKHHPLVIIALFTAVFLQLCPFEKGNQRLSRLLIVLLMFRAGYSYAPYMVLESVFNEKLQDYFNVLEFTQEGLASGQPDWEPWLLFFLLLLKDQKDMLAERIKKDGDELVDLPALSVKVLKLFEDNERLSMKEIERLTRGKRSTLKLRLGELVEGGYLLRHGKARSTWYAKV